MDLNLFIDKREIKVLLPNLVAPKTIDKFCEYLREIKTIIFLILYISHQPRQSCLSVGKQFLNCYNFITIISKITIIFI